MSVSQPVTRKLAAILAADVVGYSRHMELDDAGTLARLRALRGEVVDPAIRARGGTIVKTTGDGLLVVFPSADAALRCALEVQRAIAASDHGREERGRLALRIGINLGDVIVDGDDVFGDGVNVAARLEALAEPGGICVSAAVRDQIHGNIDAQFEDIGERQVKNIVRPIGVYRVRDALAADVGVIGGPRDSWPARLRAMAQRLARSTGRPVWLLVVVAVAAAAGASIWFTTRPAAVAGPPAMSVAVTPIGAATEDAGLVERAQSMTSDITAMLARTGTLIQVVGLSSQQAKSLQSDPRVLVSAANVRYFVAGEARNAGDAVFVDLRLTDGTTGRQLWSERVTMASALTPAERARVLHASVWRLSRSIISAEVRRVMNETPRDSAPVDDVLRTIALDASELDASKRIREKKTLLERALRRDPNLVSALTGLAVTLDQEIDNDLHVDRAQAVRLMDDVTAKAVQLNPGQPTTWVVRSIALMYAGDWNASLEASAKAMRLEPDSANLITVHAGMTLLAGRPIDALKLVDQAIALDPPGGFEQMRVACQAHLFAGRYPQAVAACDKAKGLYHDDWTVDLLTAGACAQSSDTTRAAAAKAEVLRRMPGFTIAAFRSKAYSVNPDYLRLIEEHWYSGLRKAGFPEG